MNDIEILEKYVKLLDDTITKRAIENLLKERQEDKDRIKELEEENAIQRHQLNSAFDNGFIHKDLVREKIQEEINRLKYDVSKIKEIKQTRYSDYDRIRLAAYVTKSNEIIKRLEKCVKST